MLDYPTERSSHVNPTPRGGGLAICAVVLGFIAWATLSGQISHATGFGLAGGGLVIATIGWFDDLHSLAAEKRLVTHVLAAVWTVAWLGGLDSIRIGAETFHPGIWGATLAIVALVWATNLFNFMDGIDGIAAVEGLSVAGIGALLLLAVGAPTLAIISVTIAGACLGFLAFNWAPARIFMGDVGSGFLGLILASLALASESQGGIPILVWSILAAIFIVDATATFFRRLRHGKWRDAHRSHAYQRLVRAGWSHARVAISVAALNVVLGALAALATFNPSMMLPAVIAAFVLVSGLYWLVDRVQRFALDNLPSDRP